MLSFASAGGCFAPCDGFRVHSITPVASLYRLVVPIIDRSTVSGPEEEGGGGASKSAQRAGNDDVWWSRGYVDDDAGRLRIRTPYQVGTIVEGQQPRRQLAGPNHGREHDLTPVVDAPARDRHLLGFRRHDGSDRAQEP